MSDKTVTAADARRRLPELLGRVAEGEAFVIARGGKPVARLVPLRESERPHLADVAGWLDDDDPFFEAVASIVKARERHGPRVTRKRIR
jgi:prevent-host-death family protein